MAGPAKPIIAMLARFAVPPLAIDLRLQSADWMDAFEDGEFCVALRCALVQGGSAHCYAGVGVVADSDPEAELAETEVKLQAIVPALTGI